jgi:RimJ/RimL family protein N-acetyltransferase
MIIIKTSRLLLREFIIEDAYDLYLLNNDEEVLRYTGDVPFLSIEEAKEFILRYDQYRKYRCGRLAMILTDTNEFLGWCGLKYVEHNGEYDLGFRLKKRFWNNGYATEAAQACLNYGFSELLLSCIIGRARKENTASINVLQKVGMRHVKEIEEKGNMIAVFSI